MSAALPADARFDRSRAFANLALVLGATSIVLFFLGFACWSSSRVRGGAGRAALS